MKKHDYITILGSNPINIHPAELREYGPAMSVSNKRLNFKYIDTYGHVKKQNYCGICNSDRHLLTASPHQNCTKSMCFMTTYTVFLQYRHSSIYNLM